jgi:hypothetical protein
MGMEYRTDFSLSKSDKWYLGNNKYVRKSSLFKINLIYSSKNSQQLTYFDDSNN